MAIERMLTEEMPARVLVARVLAEAGIEYVFGISGGHTGRIISGLFQVQNQVRMMTVREESLAGVMAEVYGRLTRKPGVMIGQGPWVLGNGLLGTLEAFLSSSPMVLLTDFSDAPHFQLHAPYQQATGDWGSWDARRAFGGVTKQVMQAQEPVAAVQATQLAIKHAMSGQPGPVAVLFSHDALAGDVGPDSRPVLYPTRFYLPPPPPPADAAQIAVVADRILAAERPVVIAGNGVRIAQAYDKLRAFAEAAGLPVATTAAGKGTFPETHPLALGVFGTFGTPAANACIGEADLVLVVGSKLGPSDTAWENTKLLDPTRQAFVQIDIEPRNASWNYPAEQVVLGDAAQILGQLVEAVRPRANGRSQAGQRRVVQHRDKQGYFNAPEYRSDEKPILPQRVIGELIRNLPENGIVTCDAGENRILMTHFYQTKAAGGFLQAAGSGPMGFGIPAALAAKLVYPDRPVVACVGDPGPLRYKRSRGGDTAVDRAAAYVLRGRPGSLVEDFVPWGGDERQFCSPGFDLPVGALTRTPHGLFPEYHSSADDLDLIGAESLGDSLAATLEILDVLDRDRTYASRNPYGEPQLGRRGLYREIGGGADA